jgi:hypothetical protein
MSVPNWRRNAQLFTALSTTDTIVGIYSDYDPTTGLHTVSFGSSEVQVKSSTRYMAIIGEPVILTWINKQLRLTGPARARSSEGVVIGVANPYATVVVGDNIYNMPMSISIAASIAVNDNVVIDWDYRNGYVKDKLTAAGTAGDKPPKLTLDQRPFTLYFFAKQSGSRKSFNPKGAAPAYSKWWTQDVIADDDNVGGWFYGNVIRKTLRDDAFISSVEIYLPVRTTKGGLPKIGRHTQDVRPGDNDSLSVQDAATRGARSGWVRLPTEWAETWRTTAGGVAVNDGGTTTYKGIQAARQSGKLRIRGRQ